jgi:DNA repair exonuclease SbcCD ATPase subunit
MILERLVLRNFKRFKDEEIHFSDGITGIVGNNGTGKSSIVEAILFALYGLSGTGIKPDYIVSSFAPSSEKCEVRLDFKVKGRSYSIRRKFRKSI